MYEEEIVEVFNSPAGYLGPCKLPLTKTSDSKPFILADLALKGRRNLIAGANKENYHVRNLTPEQDFPVDQWVDLRTAAEGEGCPQCGKPLRVAKAVEIGHIFKLGYKYSQSMGAHVLDKEGKEVTPIMGSYGIGMERILTSAIEQNNDENGFWLPPQIAPFEVIVVPTNAADEKLLAAALEITAQLEKAGLDTILDDRDERPGVKFKDADLIGVPFRVTVGRKLGEGKVEVMRRSTRETQNVNIGELTTHMAKLLRPVS